MSQFENDKSLIEKNTSFHINLQSFSNFQIIKLINATISRKNEAADA
jgi:hypothetical protein